MILLNGAPDYIIWKEIASIALKMEISCGTSFEHPRRWFLLCVFMACVFPPYLLMPDPTLDPGVVMNVDSISVVTGLTC